MPYKLLLLLICFTIAGCKVGPVYRTPSISAPSVWQAKKNTVGLKAIDRESLKNWWKKFNDPQLDFLISQAVIGNLDLNIAVTRINQARAERRSARAELFPAVNIGLGGQRQDNPFPSFARGLRFNLFEMGFDALWEIDLFGRLQRRLEAASAELEANQEQFRQALVSLTAEVARNYIEYRSLQNQLRITRSNQQTQERTLHLTELLQREGVGTRHDVVRARAQTENTQAQIPALEAQLIATLRQLEVLLGKQPGYLTTKLEGQSQMPSAPGKEVLAKPAETIRLRPDVRSAERRLAAATAIQGAAVAELFPKISLSAFLGLRNTDIESLLKSTAFSYSTIANLAQPLLNFGRIRAGIDLANAKQKEAYFTFEKTVLEALQEIETTLTNFLKEEERRQALTRSVVDLRESVRLSQLRYHEGVISFLDVLDAQRILYASEIDLARSEARTSTNLIALYKALGGGADIVPPQKMGEKSWAN